VLYYNTEWLLQSMVADQAAYGFTHVTQPCYNGVTVCSDPRNICFSTAFIPVRKRTYLQRRALRQWLRRNRLALGFSLEGGVVRSVNSQEAGLGRLRFRLGFG
jgi:hypothetical protein